MLVKWDLHTSRFTLDHLSLFSNPIVCHFNRRVQTTHQKQVYISILVKFYLRLRRFTMDLAAPRSNSIVCNYNEPCKQPIKIQERVYVSILVKSHLLSRQLTVNLAVSTSLNSLSFQKTLEKIYRKQRKDLPINACKIGLALEATYCGP